MCTQGQQWCQEPRNLAWYKTNSSQGEGHGSDVRDINKEEVLDLFKNNMVDKSPQCEEIYPRLLREAQEEIDGDLTEIMYLL